MSTISNERLEELANGDMEVWYSESQSMARELLALRKERERAEPVAWLVCGSKTFKDRTASTREVAEQAVKDRKDGSSIKPLYTAQQFESLASVKQPSSNLAATGKASRDSDDNSSPDSQTTIKQSDGWIPCSERMPDFYYSCLAADEHGDMVIGLPSNLEVSDKKAFCLSNGEIFLATHWQPLPEPPCK
ncbi:DUF551 domain-containing protein [Cronobacter dublinensis]